MQGVNSMGVKQRSMIWEHLHMENRQITRLQDSDTIANDGRDLKKKINNSLEISSVQTS